MDKAEMSRIQGEEEKRLDRLIAEAKSLNLARVENYFRTGRKSLLAAAVRERTTPEPSRLPSPFVYAMQ